MSNNTWKYDKATGQRFVFVNSISATRISRSSGSLLHDCPGCPNIWDLSPYRSTSKVVSRTVPVREGGEVVDFAIDAARLVDACWCGVPFPTQIGQQVTQSQARANVKAALRIALAREGELPSVVEDIQTLGTKVTSSMMRRLRGERSKKAMGVA
ncbi:MAG: hypothetical protein VYA86_03195 [Candidatus Thermoplasmatota archaeon]|nr:hypothetical protein [Candidatus Thermoplasmatota archaeon]